MALLGGCGGRCCGNLAVYDAAVIHTWQRRRRPSMMRSSNRRFVMLFALRLFAYRLVKPLQWPTSRIVAIPRPTTFVGPGAALRMCDSIVQFGLKRVLIVTDAVLVKL